MPLLPYNDEWRAHRKLAHNALSPSAVKRYYTIQEDLAALLAKQFLDTPEDFFSHIRLWVLCYISYSLLTFRRAASRLILVITYGLSVETADDEVRVFGLYQSSLTNYAAVYRARGGHHAHDHQCNSPGCLLV